MNSWPQFLELAGGEFSGMWFFRGGLAGWNLETSLERGARDWNVSLARLPEIEKGIIREFKRQLPHTTTVEQPRAADTLGWLALMQHFGAPTRLLDWTYSIFVAAYFAMEKLLDARGGAEAAVVWAIKRETLEPKIIAKSLPTGAMREAYENYVNLREAVGYFDAVFFSEAPMEFVAPVNPYRLHPRLKIQQGVFMCPGDVRTSFEQNLRAMRVPGLSPRLVKVRISRDCLPEFMKGLHRMNISRASLFPGVDGFAQRLRYGPEFVANRGPHGEVMW